MRFWDASAIVPLLWTESQSRAVRVLREQDADAAVWWGTPVECIAAMAQAIRFGRLSEVDANEARGRLSGFLRAADQIDPTDQVRDRAERLATVHPLSAADALQLAAALIWVQERPARAGFVCLDSHLRRAAGREGFDVLPADRYLA